MRFHVPCLPHTLPTKEYAHCAYTQKVLNFEKMMKLLGHKVTIYASRTPLPPEQNLAFAYDEGPVWKSENAHMIELMKAHIQPGDFIGLIAGRCHKQIADAFPDYISCEFGVGYEGIFSQFCVFESYFHMANVYGQRHIRNGRFFDEVIPNYYDLDDFPVNTRSGDYLLFVGRLNDDKGIHVAAKIAELAGMQLKVAGQGVPPAGTYYEGLVGTEKRAQLMSNARALLAPTLYLEPFGGVAVEAQLCGTPVISTDWGGFTETVEHGISGFRCHYLGEFVRAVTDVDLLDREEIASRARAKYSLEAIGPRYESYFKRLSLLSDKGWYSLD